MYREEGRKMNNRKKNTRFRRPKRRRRWLAEEVKWGMAMAIVFLLYSAALVRITRDLTLWLA